MKIVTLVDPPYGWRYGFPKIKPDNVDNLFEWLISEGYPESQIGDREKFTTRQWCEEIEN